MHRDGDVVQVTLGKSNLIPALNAGMCVYGVLV